MELDLSNGEKKLLALIWHANSVGLPAAPDCDPFKEVANHRLLLDRLKIKGLIYFTRESEDSDAGYCLTTRGDEIAGELVEMDEYRSLSSIVTERPRSKPTPAIEGKYGEITTTGKQLHPGEPVFLLRATDPIAVAAVKAYAELCRDLGCSGEHVEACHRHAKRIQVWQDANKELVKNLPD